MKFRLFFRALLAVSFLTSGNINATYALTPAQCAAKPGGRAIQTGRSQGRPEVWTCCWNVQGGGIRCEDCVGSDEGNCVERPTEGITPSTPQVVPPGAVPHPGPPPRSPATATPLPPKSSTGTLCPDPAAQRIDFSLVRQASQLKGRVRITGVIKNLGTEAFASKADPWTAALAEATWTTDSSGWLPRYGLRIVAKKPVTYLAPGQEFSLVYERDWDASSAVEGKSPPEYILAVRHTGESKKSRNDCNQENNEMKRNGAAINQKFMSPNAKQGGSSRY